MNLEKLAIQGRTKVHGSMAASVSNSKLIDMRKESLKKCFQDFFSHDHRLEYVASIHNVKFIDDSKANNMNATWYSLETMDKPVIWLTFAEMDNNYNKLSDNVRKKVKAIICIGKGIEIINNAFSDVVKKIVNVPTINEAVQYAFNISKREDIVLFSPTCPDYIGRKSFIELGEEFKRAVNRI